jgi:phytoene desaturase
MRRFNCDQPELVNWKGQDFQVMKQDSVRKKIAIVGAGPGGLTAAMVLANRGYEVEVFEKEAVVGGRNAELRLGDFRFDIGPTFLMMKFVLDQAFKEAGVDGDTLLDFRRLDPMYRLIFDGFSMDVTSDPVKMKAEIARCFPGEEAGLERFMQVEEQRFKHIYACLGTEYTSLRAFLKPSFLRAIPYIPFGRVIFDYLGNYFKSDKLRLSFTFQSKYLGMSPWECPGFFVILPYIEHAFGIFHVQGGLSEISRVMAEVAVSKGAKVHLNAKVKELILERGAVKGLRLEDGREVRADETILNADFAHAMNTLVPKGALKKYSPEKVEKLKYSCSTFMLYLGLNKTIDDLPHHNVIFAKDYRENSDDIFKRLKLSEDISFYVRNASLTDPTLAPAGKSALYVLVPVPNQGSGVDWEQHKAAFRDKVLDAIAMRTSAGDLRPHIEVEQIITPADWANSGVYRGATFNLAHTMDQMLYFRPRNKFEELENCYLVGGGTHPGSGLPTIYHSGLIAANMITEQDRKLAIK